jgi:UDP-N-acetylenolpyruvoylglucosamine reductase
VIIVSDAVIASLTEADVAGFQAALRGQLIQPGDETYDVVRMVYNGMIDRHPRLIARCVDVADVITAVNFAREHRLTLSVRGGSHNVTGFAVCDDGLVLDLSGMKGVRVDPERRTARAEGGCTWGDFDHATHAFGLATPGGVLSTTGVAGLTLGGGFGYLSRKYGLSCDNLISVDVVTAEGQFLVASADENEDLFWAVRGGGGNFGVVTSFEFELHPVGMVYGGPVFYPIEQSGEVMRFYRDFISQASEDLGAFFGFHVAPPAPFVPEHLHGAQVCAIVSCYTGPMDQAEEVLKPIRDFGTPVLDLMGPLPYPALNSLFDALLHPGLHHYWKADFVEELTDEAIAVHLQHGPHVPNFLSLMHLYPLDGAVQRVGSHETAYSYRNARFVHIIAGVDSDTTAMPEHTEWVRDYWSALHPHSAGGAYVNFLMDEGEDRIRATYRDSYERLVELKRKYDPNNLFHMNQNISPAQTVG